MLKKKNRLAGKEFTKGVFFKNELFNLKISEGNQDEPKFAFVISKKVAKSAVLRNETKRTIAKIIEDNLDKIKASKNIVIIANKIIEKEKRQEAEKNILSVFKKIKVI